MANGTQYGGQERAALDEAEPLDARYRESPGPQRGRRDNEGRLRTRLDGLHELLKSTEKAFDVHVQRINPTLNPTLSPSVDPGQVLAGRAVDPVAAESPLAEQLEAMRTDLQALYDRIVAVTERIEV